MLSNYLKASTVNIYCDKTQLTLVIWKVNDWNKESKYKNQPWKRKSHPYMLLHMSRELFWSWARYWTSDPIL